MKKTTYAGPQKEILLYPEGAYARPVILDRTAFATVANANGGVVPAGTIVYFDLENRAVKAQPVGENKPATGVLRHDVVLADHEAEQAAAIIHGIINLDKLPAAPTATDKTALKHIIFAR